VSVTIYHNPACGTSRNTLEMIRQSGETPPDYRIPEEPAGSGAADRTDQGDGDPGSRAVA
jgi:hypothetical protein